MESVLLSSENAGYNVYPLYSAYRGLSFAITGAKTAITINKKGDTNKLEQPYLLNWFQAYFLNEKFLNFVYSFFYLYDILGSTTA